MFIEFDDMFINENSIKWLRHYKSDNPDIKKPYRLNLKLNDEDWEVREQFTTQDELDARYQELKKLLCGESG